MATNNPITGLPSGFKIDETEPSVPQGFQLDDPASPKIDETEPSLPQGFTVDEPEPETGFFGNVIAGTFERAADLGGSFLDAIKTVGAGLEEAVPLGGFAWDEGDILPSYKSPEELAKLESFIGKGAGVLKNIDLGYQERTNWQDVKDSFKEGGALSGSAYADVMAFAAEQGIKSIPDMLAVVSAFPAYIVARSGEIGEQRAKNKGKTDADITDVLEAVPTAVASALLERIGTKGMTSVVQENIGKELMKSGLKNAAKRVAKEGGKAVAKEATTEAIQEGMIEYVGERYNTDVAMDFSEALDRGFGAAVAGGIFGGVVGGGVATQAEISRAVTPPLAAPTPEVDVSPEILDASSTDGAIDEAVKVINKELDIHAKKLEAADMPIEAQPIIQEELFAQPEAPQVEKIKAQKTLKLDEEADLVKREAAEEVTITEPDTVPKPQPSEEKIRVPKEARIEPEDKIRRAEEAYTTEALVRELKLSKDVPQIKKGADVKGVVEPLGGTFDPIGTGPLQVWVRKDGTQEVISGRHRLDLAKRSGTKAVSVQKHFEDEGFTLQDAKSLDAILNIREGQGQVKDYVDFMKTTKLTEAEAQEQGLLARNIGKQAFTVATKGSALLIDKHAQGDISDSAATKISLAAPNNESLQAVGLKALDAGKTITVAENMTKAVSTLAPAKQKEPGDLFGFDDAALIEAENLAKAAGAKQATIQKTLSAIQGAAKDPKRAAKEGVDVKDPVAVQSRIDALKKEKARWGQWHSDTKLVSELKDDIADKQQAEEDLFKEDAKKLDELTEAAPTVAEIPKAKKVEPEKVAAPKVKPKDTSVRLEAYKTTLGKDVKVDQASFENFIADMKSKFDASIELLPKGTITNQKDFTHFIQAQTGQKVPLNEISLTRKIKGKDGKLKIAQVKADTVLRQTKKKRDVAIDLLRCIHG